MTLGKTNKIFPNKAILKYELNFGIINLVRRGRDKMSKIKRVQGNLFVLEKSAAESFADFLNAEELFDKGFEAVNQNDFVSALKYFKKALALNPDHCGALLNLGRIFHLTRAYGRAEKLTRQVLEIEPNNVQAHFNLGVILCSPQGGRVVEGIKHYKKVIEESLGSP